MVHKRTAKGENVLGGLKHDKPIIWRVYECKKEKGKRGENGDASKLEVSYNLGKREE